jgi:hypothetical protein
MVILPLITQINLYRYKRTIGRALLFSIPLTILLFSLAVLFGFVNKSLENIYFQNGDISISPTSTEGSLADVNSYVSGTGYEGAAVYKSYSKRATIITSAGYNSTGVEGITEEYFDILRSSYSWYSEPVFDSNSVLLDISFAKRIGVAEGGTIIIQIQVLEGEINAYQYTVGGLFFGNSYFQSTSVYMQLEEFQWLWMREGDFINGILLFFGNTQMSFDQLQKYADEIKSVFGTAVSVANRYQMQDRFMSSYYLYVCIFYSAMIFLINFSLLMVFGFSLYSHYYNEFCLRRKEFFTLFSFGLSPARMKLYVLLDTCMVFLSSLVPFALFSLAVKLLCESVVVNSVKYSEFISLIGSNRILLDYNIAIVLITVLSLFATSIISGFFGLKKFEAIGAYS